MEGKGRGGWCEVVWESVGMRGSVRGGVGARMVGGEGGFGAQKEIIILYYDRAPQAREFFWSPCPP